MTRSWQHQALVILCGSVSLPGFSVTVPDNSRPWHTSGVDHLARALREEELNRQDSSDISQWSKIKYVRQVEWDA